MNKQNGKAFPDEFCGLCTAMEQLDMSYQTGTDEFGCFFAATDPLVPITITFLPQEKLFSLIAAFQRPAAMRHRTGLPALLCRINLELTQGCFGADKDGHIYYRTSLKVYERAPAAGHFKDMLQTACRHCAQRAGVFEALADDEGVIDSQGVWHLDEKLADKSEIQAKKIAQDTEQILKAQELEFCYTEEEGLLKGAAQIPGTNSVISSVIDTDKQMLVLCCALPVHLSDEAAAIMAQALCRLNSIVPGGCFCVKDGQVMFRTSLCFRHSDISVATLYDTIMFCRWVAGSYFTLLQRLSLQKITLDEFCEKTKKA